jgi:hypothetical protein
MSDIPVVKVPMPARLYERKRVWDNYAVIGEVQKSEGLKLVIAAGIRDGVRCVSIREFYCRKTDNVWKPGRDGITIPLRIPVDNGTRLLNPYDEFAKLLEETKEALEVMELSDDENAVYIIK